MNLHFYILRFSQTIFDICLRMYQIAISWILIERQHDAYFLSLILMVQMITKLAFNLIAWPFTDRPIKRTLYIASYFFAALAILSSYYFVQSNLYSLLIISAILVGISESVAVPLSQSFIPLIVEENEIEMAMKKVFTLSSISQMIGLFVGSFLIKAVGDRNVILMSSLLLILAFIVILNLKLRNIPINSKKSYWNDFVEGIKGIQKIKFELHWSMYAAIFNGFLTPFFVVMLPFFVNQYLKVDASFLAIIELFFCLGVFFGSSQWLMRLVRFFSPQICDSSIPILGVWSISLSLGAFFIFSQYFLSGVLKYLICIPLFTTGVGLVLINVTTETKRSLAIKDSLRGKIFSIHFFIIQSVSPLFIFIYGYFLNNQSYFQISYLTWSAVILMSVLLPFIPHYRMILDSSHEKIKNIYPRLYNI